MAKSSGLVGYKKVFGFILPEWVDEKTVNKFVGYVLVSLVMVFTLLLLVKPNMENAKKLESQYKTESSRLESMRNSKKSLDSLFQTVSNNEQKMVFRAMPLNYSPEEAVYAFRRVANEVGVSIAEYSLPEGVVFEEVAKEFTGKAFKDQNTSIDYKTFVIQVTVNGQIGEILNFIDRVQKSLPLGFVSDLQIQEVVKAAELKKSQSVVSLKLSVQYYQPVLKSFNVASLQEFSDSDMALIKELAGYESASVPSADVSYLQLVATGSGERSLFGQ